MKRLSDLIGTTLELKELPQLYFGLPNVMIGNKYKIVDVEGSNLCFIDGDGNKSSIGSCRFILN